ncbi:MAG TPA: SCO family protein [Gammaproteobacteria bacterium]|jgi:protein SCO1/2
MKFKTLLAYAGLSILVIAAGVFAGHAMFHPQPAPRPRTDALMLHEPKSLPDFALTDTDGKPFTRQSLTGHWSLLYFGYTHCPDACPTTLSGLDHLMGALAKSPAAPKPTVYFISVDPKRDDLKLLKNYTLYFNPSFIGATGSEAALRALTAPMGVDFSYGTPDKQGDYAVDHTSFVILVDKQGEEVAIFSPPLDPKRTSADYLNILKYYGETW